VSDGAGDSTVDAAPGYAAGINLFRSERTDGSKPGLSTQARGERMTEADLDFLRARFDEITYHLGRRKSRTLQ
jgi:hypothetical protein